VKLGKEPLQQLPANRATRLDNVTCPYCGTELTDETRSKEHVIGRRFVPKGTLNRQWNLIVNSCEPCNAAKADLEDDLSALTMHPDPHGWRGHESEALKNDTVRKVGKSISRLTGKPVADSHDDLSVKFVAEGFSMTFSGITPPQIDEERAKQLAMMQAYAFFYLASYNKETKRGGWFQGKVLFVNAARRGDWGNVRARYFMDTVGDWEPLLILSGAEGHFRIAIGRQPGVDCWSYAVEWNEAYRLMFFIGIDEVLEPLARAMPEFKFHDHKGFDGKVAFRMRLDVPLPEEDDDMFQILDRDDETKAD